MDSESAQATDTSTSPSFPTPLRIPEILHLIFSFANYSDPEDYYPRPRVNSLPRFALVNSTWSRVAQSLLYRNLNLVWRFCSVQPLVRTFENNPSLLRLVRSCYVTSFDWDDLWDEVREDIEYESEERFLQELGYSEEEIETEWDRVQDETEDARFDRIEKLMSEHGDYHWTGEGRTKSYCALVDLLRSTPLLQELSIRLLTANEDDILLPELHASDLDRVLENLTTLSLIDSDDPFTRCLLFGTKNLVTLQLKGCSATLVLPSLPGLRHLVINEQPYIYTPNIEITAFKDTLETLSIGLVESVVKPNKMPLAAPFSRLTHLQLLYGDYGETRLFLKIAVSLLSFTPNLRHLNLSNGPPLQKLLPFLPSTVVSIHNHVDFVDCKPPSAEWYVELVEACSQRANPRPLHLVLYTRPTLLGLDYTGLMVKAREQGINLHFLPLPLAYVQVSDFAQKFWYREASV